MKFPQSAVIPYLQGKDGAISVVLVTSMNTGEWSFPKGLIEDGMTAEESACKEAEEEGGIAGTITGKILCEYEYKKWGGVCHVQVFALKVSEMADHWDECDRKRRVFPIEEGIKVIRSDQVRSLKALLRRLQAL